MSKRPSQCRHCKSLRVRLHGKTSSGRQRFACAECKRTFTRLSGNSLATLRLRSRFLRFVQLMSRGNSVRQDAATLGVAHSTVWRWRHRMMHRLYEPDSGRIPKTAQAAIVVHRPVLRERRVWGLVGNGEWAGRHLGNVLAPYMRGLDRPTDWRITFVACVGAEDGCRFALRYGPHDMNHFSGGSNTQVYALTGTWLFPVSFRPGGMNTAEGMSILNLLKQEASSVLNRARVAVLALEQTFRGWMARFRGVATKHLTLYIAWFATLLEKGLIVPVIHLTGVPARWQRL